MNMTFNVSLISPNLELRPLRTKIMSPDGKFHFVCFDQFTHDCSLEMLLISGYRCSTMLVMLNYSLKVWREKYPTVV